MNAPWQIYFHFVPADILKKEKDFELTWDFNRMTKAVKNYFGDILWQKNGIFYNIKQYGNLNETCIELSTMDEKTCNVVFTFDLRSITEEFVMLFCEFASYMNGAILLSDGNYVKAEFGTVVKLIAYSQAAQYCMYIEPIFAKKRDEYLSEEGNWWEYHIPDHLKKKTSKEISEYIENYFKEN